MEKSHFIRENVLAVENAIMCSVEARKRARLESSCLCLRTFSFGRIRCGGFGVAVEVNSKEQYRSKFGAYNIEAICSSFSLFNVLDLLLVYKNIYNFRTGISN